MSSVVDLHLHTNRSDGKLSPTNLVQLLAKQNLEYVSSHVNFSKSISEEQKYILSDAQTSGGLLISVAKEKANDLQILLNENSCLKNSIIGNVYNPAEFFIYVD